MIRIRESIYEGARQGKGRDRFTIMHEIFHFMWHDRDEISFARNPESVKLYENPEWQADVFAGSVPYAFKVDKRENRKSSYEGMRCIEKGC